MIIQAMGPLEGRRLGVLGLAFKNNTDDMRDAPSVTIISDLAACGTQFRVYDPKAMHNAVKVFESKGITSLHYCEDEYDTVKGVEGVILMTEWNQFRSLDLERIKENMSGDFFFDLRNIYSKELMLQKGFRYYCVGR
jgi:UDPglucose 6-dehydrogenase